MSGEVAVKRSSKLTRRTAQAVRRAVLQREEPAPTPILRTLFHSSEIIHLGEHGRIISVTDAATLVFAYVDAGENSPHIVVYAASDASEPVEARYEVLPRRDK